MFAVDSEDEGCVDEKEKKKANENDKISERISKKRDRDEENGDNSSSEKDIRSVLVNDGEEIESDRRDSEGYFHVRLGEILTIDGLAKYRVASQSGQGVFGTVVLCDILSGSDDNILPARQNISSSSENLQTNPNSIYSQSDKTNNNKQISTKIILCNFMQIALLDDPFDI